MIIYSIIQKSQLDSARRIDAEYFQPEYFIDFSKGKWIQIGDILEVCQYGISQAMNEIGEGYPIFRMDDIKNAYLVKEEPKYVKINEGIFQQYKLFVNDVLFNRVNSEEFVGRTGIYKLLEDFVFASYLIRLRVKKTSNILPDYLNIFLNSSYGIKQIRKYRRRAVNQANVNAEELKQIKIAIIPESIQKIIENLSNTSWTLYLESESLYIQAENLLLSELGLKDYKIDEDLSYVVNFSNVKLANRMDAEYFQPKYDKLISGLNNKFTKPLNYFVINYTTGYPFKSDHYQENGKPLIRINNIKRGSLDLTDTTFLSEKDYLLSPKDNAKPGDIVLSMSGSIGLAAKIPDDIPKSSINQRILKFTPKNIESEYLALVLNSIVGSLQLERIGTGGVQTNISYKDIQGILIPILPKETQQKIADLVRKSYEARKKSKELLEEAKRKVEEMIEKESPIDSDLPAGGQNDERR